MHEQVGEYAVSDIEPVCGFDIDERKTNHDLGRAIFASPNCAEEFADVPDDIGAPVYRGPVLDGVAPHTQKWDATGRISVDEGTNPVDIAETLERHDADVLLLPACGVNRSR